MKTKKDYIDSLNDELLNDSSSQNEERLNDWSEQYPDYKKIREIISRIRVSPEITQQGQAVSGQILQQVNQQINSYMRRRVWLRVGGLAASFLLLLGVSNYISYQEGYKQLNSQILQIENPLGMRTSLTLPDGTQVTLNAGTTLHYPTAFTGKNREVILSGEAFFDVKEDKSHPFIVKTDELNVKVTGTSFNVKAYEEENTVDVTLVDGKVGVYLNDNPKLFMMNPGEQISYHKSDQRLRTLKVNVNYYICWIDGIFYFNNTTIEDIARQLERKFNVHITIGSEELKNVSFTGDFVRGENLEQILRVMAFDRRIQYVIDGDMVDINEK